ncbi:hypothetical protein ACFYKX_11285 [Cytobacillus sp. FJAT-54145]|uniref:Uncharacterized protein n=1 Tax=Cytobacillus spartinae TaxID=3299023 RepID=A0ABW6KE57_9BACI
MNKNSFNKLAGTLIMGYTHVSSLTGNENDGSDMFQKDPKDKSLYFFSPMEEVTDAMTLAQKMSEAHEVAIYLDGGEVTVHTISKNKSIPSYNEVVSSSLPFSITLSCLKASGIDVASLLKELGYQS